MSTRGQSTITSKDASRTSGGETKSSAGGTPNTSNVKTVAPILKGLSNKVSQPSAMPTSPIAVAPTEDRDELLGSLTTLQQQRTSARVIKKLRLDDAAADRDKKDNLESDSIVKPEEKEKLNTVKQRMPKALWSTDEKNLFFEALNKYGKDFDAITAFICAKMKKKGVSDVNLKNKQQVSHFYYRTWHKLSKHVHFDEKVKRVAQELYSLINFGELRKRLSLVKEKTCARLGEMVASGGLVVRERGRNLRVRTPACRALRRLNAMAERACAVRVAERGRVELRARSGLAWARVQAAAHNPRLALAAPPRTALAALLAALALRFRCRPRPESGKDTKSTEKYGHPIEDVNGIEEGDLQNKQNNEDNLGNHLNLQTDQMINRTKNLVLHVGPRPNAEIHLPTVSLEEQLSSQKICFASYLDRIGTSQRRDSGPTKLRTPKRQRKDSNTEKEKESEQKKTKMEDTDYKPMNIDDMAIDGIELMASLSENRLTEDEKPSTECDEEQESERDKDMFEREKDSFSEMEDDEKYNKSDTDNESDKFDKFSKDGRFKDLKVKFQIRPKDQGGNTYSVMSDNINPVIEENKMEENKVEDTSKNVEDKLPDNKTKPPDNQNKRADNQNRADDHIKSADDQNKNVEGAEDDIDVDYVMRQIRTGWSVYDAGQLTIGDLYLMFGSRSKLELDYWWAEPSPPLPQPWLKAQQRPKQLSTDNDKHTMEKEKVASQEKNRVEKITPEKESSEEDREKMRESDNEMFSPRNEYNQDSNDRLSGDERKGELVLSPECKAPRVNSLRIADKLVNRPREMNDDHRSVMTDRLRRLISLASSITSNLNRRKPPEKSLATGKGEETEAPVFRHPAPMALAQRSSTEVNPLPSNDIPSWRRGRRRADSGVVVQRLLPVLPKLTPPPNNLIPVKLVSNTSLPSSSKPPTATTEEMSGSYVYVVRTNGQYYFHRGDTKLTPIATEGSPPLQADDAFLSADSNFSLSSLISHLDQERMKQEIEGADSNASQNPARIAPNDNTKVRLLNLNDLPRLPRGRPRHDDRTVVHRLLPLLPKMTAPPTNLPTATQETNSVPSLPKILPKPTKENPNDSYVYVVTSGDGNFYLHRGFPLDEKSQQSEANIQLPEKMAPSVSTSEATTESKMDTSDNFSGLLGVSPGVNWGVSGVSGATGVTGVSPNSAGEWLLADSDFSLSSFLSQLEHARSHDIPMDSQVQSLMTESSIDYVAQFAELAAEVNKDNDRPPIP